MKLSIKRYLPSFVYLACNSLFSIVLFVAFAVVFHQIIWVPKAKRAEVARILNA